MTSTSTLTRPCPFCTATVDGVSCPRCRRDPTAPRIVCDQCQKMTPKAENVCCHCQARHTSDLAWKVPVIVAMFVVVFILSVIVAIAGA